MFSRNLEIILKCLVAASIPIKDVRNYFREWLGVEKSSDQNKRLKLFFSRDQTFIKILRDQKSHFSCDRNLIRTGVVIKKSDFLNPERRRRRRPAAPRDASSTTGGSSTSLKDSERRRDPTQTLKLSLFTIFIAPVC